MDSMFWFGSPLCLHRYLPSKQCKRNNSVIAEIYLQASVNICLLRRLPRRICFLHQCNVFTLASTPTAQSCHTTSFNWHTKRVFTRPLPEKATKKHVLLSKDILRTLGASLPTDMPLKPLVCSCWRSYGTKWPSHNWRLFPPGG